MRCCCPDFLTTIGNKTVCRNVIIRSIAGAYEDQPVNRFKCRKTYPTLSWAGVGIILMGQPGGEEPLLDRYG